MDKQLILILLVLLPIHGLAQILAPIISNAPTTPPPAITQVKSCSGNSTPVSCSMDGGMTAGNVAVVAAVSSSGACTGVTSTPSNIWQPWIAQTNGGSQRITMFVARNVASGTNSLVVTCPGASSWVSAIAYELSNVTAADVVGSATGTGGAPSLTTIQPVGSSTQEVIASFFDDNDFITWVAGAGYTVRGQVNASGSAYLGASEDNNTKTGLTGAQTATISGVGATGWTGAILTLAYTPTPDSADTYISFEGLTNTSVPTATAMKTSTHGVPLTWDVSNAGTYITGTTAAQLANFPTAHQIGATAWTGAGSLGLAYATGTLPAKNITGTFQVQPSSVYWIGQFRTTLPQNDTATNAYTLTQVSNDDGTDYFAPQLQSSGSALSLAFECGNGPAAGTFAIASNTTYYIAVHAANNSGTASMTLYDSAGSQIGSPLTCSAKALNKTFRALAFGVNGNEPQGAGALYWDNIRISLQGATLTP